jgi:potassium voltage-gated channel Shab-related subfamily B protein 1
LLKDVSRRVLVQVKMRKWASLYGRSDIVGQNAEIAERGQRGWKDKVYLLLEFPETSKAAHRISQFSILVIMLSIVSFLLESVPELHTYGGTPGIPESGWFAIETIFTFLFSLEFILRFVVTPRKWHFWADGLNWCDFVAIVPFYFEVILALSAGTEPWNFQVDDENIKVALRVVKLFRVLRVFKMTRQFPASRLILDTFIFSADALLVPMFFLLVFVLIFASMLFFLEGGQWIDPAGEPCEYYCAGGTYVYADSGDSNPHLSIFTCFWVMIITITTVGYGDIFPTTTMGRLVAICAMIFGIIYTAMPLAIVGSYFFDAYDKQKKALSSPDDLAKTVSFIFAKNEKRSIK